MRSFIIAAALAVTAFVGIASAQYVPQTCFQDCWRDSNGGMHCSTRCY